VLGFLLFVVIFYVALFFGVSAVGLSTGVFSFISFLWFITFCLHEDWFPLLYCFCVCWSCFTDKQGYTLSLCLLMTQSWPLGVLKNILCLPYIQINCLFIDTQLMFCFACWLLLSVIITLEIFILFAQNEVVLFFQTSVVKQINSFYIIRPCFTQKSN